MGNEVLGKNSSWQKSGKDEKYMALGGAVSGSRLVIDLSKSPTQACFFNCNGLLANVKAEPQDLSVAFVRSPRTICVYVPKRPQEECLKLKWPIRPAIGWAEKHELCCFLYQQTLLQRTSSTMDSRFQGDYISNHSTSRREL